MDTINYRGSLPQSYKNNSSTQIKTPTEATALLIKNEENANPLNDSQYQNIDNISISSQAQNESIGAVRPGTKPPPKAELKRIDNLFKAASKKYGVPLNYIRAVAWQESKWCAKGVSVDQGHGKGVMQIDDRSHKFAKTNAVWNARLNIDYGVKFLKSLKKQHGSWWKAIAAYNSRGNYSYSKKVWAHLDSKPWNKYLK